MDLRKVESELRRNNERAQDEYFESDFPELKTDRETKQPRPSVIL
jgi:hypothetical protein